MKRAIVLLVIVGIVATAAPFCCAVERSAIIIGSRVQMHESAAGDSPTVVLLSEGATADILGRKPTPDRVEGFTDYWYHIACRGKTGWVFGQFIAPSTGGRGLARIFTAAEMADYADHAVKNLSAIRKAGHYAALIDASNRLLADITEMSEDPILLPYVNRLEPYRLFGACLAAEGYAGTGDINGAEKIRKHLLTCNPGTTLPDKTTLGAKIDDLDKMIQEKGKTTQ
jgi:hypothetical protein